MSPMSNMTYSGIGLECYCRKLRAGKLPAQARVPRESHFTGKDTRPGLRNLGGAYLSLPARRHRHLDPLARRAEGGGCWTTCWLFPRTVGRTWAGSVPVPAGHDGWPMSGQKPICEASVWIGSRLSNNQSWIGHTPTSRERWKFGRSARHAPTRHHQARPSRSHGGSPGAGPPSPDASIQL
jgi:hypothetical protein